MITKNTVIWFKSSIPQTIWWPGRIIRLCFRARPCYLCYFYVMGHFYVRCCHMWLPVAVPSGRKGNMPAPIPKSFLSGPVFWDLAVLCSFGYNLWKCAFTLLARFFSPTFLCAIYPPPKTFWKILYLRYYLIISGQASTRLLLVAKQYFIVLFLPFQRDNTTFEIFYCEKWHLIFHCFIHHYNKYLSNHL